MHVIGAYAIGCTRIKYNRAEYINVWELLWHINDVMTCKVYKQGTHNVSYLVHVKRREYNMSMYMLKLLLPKRTGDEYFRLFLFSICAFLFPRLFSGIIEDVVQLGTIYS